MSVRLEDKIWRVLRQWPATMLAAVLSLLWLALMPPTADLSAQLYRAHLFSAHGWTLWDNYWYGGHYLLGYSVLYPPLAALIGVKLLGVLACIGAIAAAEILIRIHYTDHGWIASCWLAAGLAAQLLSGRVTFVVGLLGVALMALALDRSLRFGQSRNGLGKPWLILMFFGAVFSGLASPVAALFSAVIGIAVVLTAEPRRRAVRDGLLVTVLALVPVGILAWAFPEGGSEPFSFASAWQLLLAGVVLLVVLARVRNEKSRLIATGVVIYLVGALASMALSTTVGGNVVRFGDLVFGPLLALTLCDGQRSAYAAGQTHAAAGRDTKVGARLGLAALVIAILGFAYIQLYDGVSDALRATAKSDTAAAYYQPLVRFLASRPGARRGAFRVEVPLTLEHWESYYVAREIPIARGWERQLDVADDSLFYKHHKLTAATYRAWLDALAVRYVAVSDGRLDHSARAEVRLIDQGLSYLRLIARPGPWRVYEVQDPTPIVSGAATLAGLDSDSVTLNFTHSGLATVRIRYSPYWKLYGAHGCVYKFNDFIAVHATQTGIATLKMSFAPGRVRSTSPRCS